MSTKIYEAYRIREDCDPWETLWSIQTTARLVARTRLREIFEEIADGRTDRELARNIEINAKFSAWCEERHPGVLSGRTVMHLVNQWSEETKHKIEPVAKTTITRSQILTDLGEKDDEILFKMHVDRWFFQKFCNQIHEHRRNEWDLSSCVAVRVHRGRYYLIPHCERISLTGNVLESMTTDDRLEDFCYYNNMDPPDALREQWPHRREIWEHFFDVGWERYVVLDILSPSTWSEIVDFTALRGI